MKIYVAAPFQDRPLVRDVHDALMTFGFIPVSTWAYSKAEKDIASLDEARPAIEQNDRDLARADAVLVLARLGAGAEMFCEMTRALLDGKPVYWIGRRSLSAYRPGVTRCEDTQDAVRHMLTEVARRAALSAKGAA